MNRADGCLVTFHAFDMQKPESIQTLVDEVKKKDVQVDVLMKRARGYLTNERAIDGSRLVIINGGFREADNVELWLVPRGAAAPGARAAVHHQGNRPQAVVHQMAVIISRQRAHAEI